MAHSIRAATPGQADASATRHRSGSHGGAGADGGRRPVSRCTASMADLARSSAAGGLRCGSGASVAAATASGPVRRPLARLTPGWPYGSADKRWRCGEPHPPHDCVDLDDMSYDACTRRRGRSRVGCYCCCCCCRLLSSGCCCYCVVVVVVAVIERLTDRPPVGPGRSGAGVPLSLPLRRRVRCLRGGPRGGPQFVRVFAVLPAHPRAVRPGRRRAGGVALAEPRRDASVGAAIAGVRHAHTRPHAVRDSWPARAAATRARPAGNSGGGGEGAVDAVDAAEREPWTRCATSWRTTSRPAGATSCTARCSTDRSSARGACRRPMAPLPLHACATSKRP